MAAASRTGLVALIRRGWDEIPEVMGSAFMGTIGLGLSIYAVWQYEKKDGDNRRYKMIPTIYRPEDPRAAKIRTD